MSSITLTWIPRGMASILHGKGLGSCLFLVFFFFFFCFAKIHLALLYFRFFRTFHDVNDAVMTGMVGARGLVTIR